MLKASDTETLDSDCPTDSSFLILTFKNRPCPKPIDLPEYAAPWPQLTGPEQAHDPKGADHLLPPGHLGGRHGNGLGS